MLESFSVLFLSILLEALPFVLIGTLVASLIEMFVSEAWIAKRISSNNPFAFLLAGLMGFVFPVCECAIVPIVRRLVKKGMPIGVAMTFMLSTPIVNPVVLLSTYYAFSNQIEMPFLRGLAGYSAAVLIGLVIHFLFQGKNVLIEGKSQIEEEGCGCGHEHEYEHVHNHEENQKKSLKNKIIDKVSHILRHMSHELLDVGRFLIFGALIATSMQVFVSRDLLLQIGRQEGMAYPLMMVMAFVLSLCSEADAFIAATFSQQFSTGPLLAFLILGPMIDIKNTLMLLAGFKKRFVVVLIAVIIVVTFAVSYLYVL